MFDCGFSPYLGTSKYEIVLTADSASQCPERVPRIDSLKDLPANRTCPELSVLSAEGGGTPTGKANGGGRVGGQIGGMLMGVGLVVMLL